MAEVILNMNALSRRFRLRDGYSVALDDVTGEISRGEQIAVVGPSGSGKSTLLAIMAKLDEPTSGEITWPGLGDPTDLRPRRIGLAFQTPSLVPALSVVENVELPLLILDDPGEPRGRAFAALDRLHLGHLAERLPEELSGGQAHRVAIARAMVAEPDLLLADEPTGQLDQDTGQTLINLLVGHAEEKNTALVIATHDPAIARRMKSTWRLAHGRLEVSRRLRVVS
jgi:putative ABC transport system ATP-binding protein/lipoprotein-releasing system ATP-binding protein